MTARRRLKARRTLVSVSGWHYHLLWSQIYEYVHIHIRVYSSIFEPPISAASDAQLTVAPASDSQLSTMTVDSLTSGESKENPNPDDSGLVALTRPETTLVNQIPSNASPAWSPDGQHIIYLSNRDADEKAGAWRLWIMDVDSGNKRRLPINMVIDYNYSREQVVS